MTRRHSADHHFFLDDEGLLPADEARAVRQPPPAFRRSERAVGGLLVVEPGFGDAVDLSEFPHDRHIGALRLTDDVAQDVTAQAGNVMRDRQVVVPVLEKFLGPVFGSFTDSIVPTVTGQDIQNLTDKAGTWLYNQAPRAFDKMSGVAP